MANTPDPLTFKIKAVNEASPVIKATAEDAKKIGAAVQQSAQVGSASLKGLLGEVTSFQRQVRRLGSLVLLPLGGGALFGAFDRLVEPFIDLIKDMNEANDTFAKLATSAALFGQKTIRDIGQVDFQFQKLIESGVKLSDIAKVIPAAFAEGTQASNLDLVIHDAELLSKALGIDLLEATKQVSGALQGNVADLKKLSQETRLEIATTSDLKLAFDHLQQGIDFGKISGQIKQLREATLRQDPTIAGIFGFASVPDEIRDLEKKRADISQALSVGLPKLAVADPEQEKAVKGIVDLTDKLRKLGEQAADAAPFDDLAGHLRQIREKSETEINGIITSVDKALEKLRPTGGGAPGQTPAGAALIRVETGAVRLIQDKEAAQIREALEKEGLDARKKRDKENEESVSQALKLDTEAQRERIRQQDQLIETISDGAVRAGTALADVWTQYDQGLIKSRDLTRNVLAALLKEFSGDAVKSIAKALVTSLIGQGAAAAAGGGGAAAGDDSDILAGKFEHGGLFDGSRSFGGESISQGVAWHSYRNAPSRRFADGGVFRGATRVGRNIGGEGGAEAWIRMKGGKIPVELAGQSGGGWTIAPVFNITAMDAQDASRGVLKASETVIAIYRDAIARNVGGMRDQLAAHR